LGSDVWQIRSDSAAGDSCDIDTDAKAMAGKMQRRTTKPKRRRGDAESDVFDVRGIFPG
jgi:hypothetical protein